MKGVITKTLLTVCGASLLAAAGGCYGYKDLVEPCYPDRYEFMAREEVKTALGAQVQNGHILDQTMRGYFFEPGTAKLTPGGVNQLIYLVRRRPAPDPVIYLQSATVGTDVVYDAANPQVMAEKRF